ncbi:cupin domain-containing protein [Leptospira licerasiae]|uniref:cupin domain-containing protein n=1 Tax=Leptospira licerasiae TaxID=447106 RepID=UPI0010831923|nr:cupin domain-containing protein [Leptospira licerasiae]TGM86741.1 cupin domain-containing protein [Leptospira licerasiae]
MKQIKVLLYGILAYIFLGSLLHHMIFPEPAPPSDLYPMQGDTIINNFASEKVIFLKTDSSEFSEAELFLKPGGAIPKPHIHPNYDETFIVKKGELTVVCDGKTYELKPGESFTIPKGTAHQPFNHGSLELNAIVRVKPSGKWALFLTQIHGFFTENETPRNDFSFFLQAMLVTGYYDDTYLASPPVSVQKILSFLISPTARLLGFRSWKREYSMKWRKEQGISEN